MYDPKVAARMAYAKRKARLARNKTPNKPVARAMTTYQKAPASAKPTKQYVANNRNAIVTLSKQVRNLQLAQLGAFQKRAEKVDWAKTESATLPWGKSQPMAICLNQFVDKKLGTDA